MKNIEPRDIFSALSNPVRLRCLYAVATSDDVCVCEIVAALGIAQPAASKALTALREAGILTARKDANWTYYSLSAELPDWLRQTLDGTVAELGRSEPYRSDRRRLAGLELRPVACA